MRSPTFQDRFSRRLILLRKHLSLVGFSVLVGCVSRSYNASSKDAVPAATRAPSVHALAPAADALDPKFERYWKDSAKEEEKEVAATSQLIRTFVRERAALQAKWKPEYEALAARAAKGERLSRRETDRLGALRNVFEELPQKNGFATRDVNRRAQGCFAADLTFRDDIPDDLRKGLFIPSKRYDAVVRFSNSNHRNQHDFVPDARAVAVKLLDEGTLPLAPDGVTKTFPWSPGGALDAAALNRLGRLDFNAINFPVYFSSDPVNYRRINEGFLAQSNSPANGLPYRLGELKAVFFSGSDAWHRELARHVHGSLVTNLLSESYFGMMAFRLGAFEDDSRLAYKFKWEPCATNSGVKDSPAWTKKRVYAEPFEDWKKSIPEATLAELSTPENFYFLRKRLFADLDAKNWQGELSATPKACFDLRVQRFIDEKNTPIEDVTRPWLESDSQRAEWAEFYAGNVRFLPFTESKRAERRAFVNATTLSPAITIARLNVHPVDSEIAQSVREGKSANSETCESLSFNPWNNVPSAHKPLGVMGRMRKGAYAASRDMRHELNGVPPMK